MINSDKEIRKRLEPFFDGDDKYYVYALIDENQKVFYIGKGTGSRVLSHEEEWKNEKKEIDEEKDANERERLQNELKKKIKKIEEIEANGGNIDRVMVKYGLTEHEAFMAESALINLLKYLGNDLTNIVNGHASEQEKRSRADEKTKARSISDFLEECARETISVSDIDEKMMKEAIFISINELAPHCNKDRELFWDAVRGEWPMNKRKANNIKYIFAMSQSIICAVFEVKSGSVKEILSDDNSKMPKRPESDIILREKEYELAQRIAELYKSNNGEKKDIIKIILDDKKCIDLSKEAFNKDEDEAKKRLNNWTKRKYFTERIKKDEDALNDRYAGKILKDNNGDFAFASQKSFKYGEDIIKK